MLSISVRSEVPQHVAFQKIPVLSSTTKSKRSIRRMKSEKLIHVEKGIEADAQSNLGRDLDDKNEMNMRTSIL